MKKSYLWIVTIASVFLFYGAEVFADGDNGKIPRWTIEEVLGGDLPFAIGHRGYGENLGENPEKPIENTVESVRRAFEEGVQIVEVDVVLSKDKRALVRHDDYLEDYTCINSLNSYELRDVSTLRHVLQVARTFSYKKNNERSGGQVIIEIKTPAPLCDPDDVTVPDLVAAVLEDIRQTKMEEQVMIESFSPEILTGIRQGDVGLRLVLGINILQLMTPEEIEEITGLPVTAIDKDAGFGLQWGEIGPFFRLPGYSSIFEYINTLLLADSRAASLDKMIIGQMEQASPGSAAYFISQLHLAGLEALVYTVDTAEEWYFLSLLGTDGIYTNDIPMGLYMESQ